jgi:hypothetical protein
VLWVGIFILAAACLVGGYFLSKLVSSRGGAGGGHRPPADLPK